MPGYFDPLPPRNVDEDSFLQRLRSKPPSSLVGNPARISTGSEGLTIEVNGAEVAQFASLGLKGIEAASDTEPNSRTFTNAGYLDLDALTGGAGSIAAVSASVVSGTRLLIIITAQLGPEALISYRISGDTTVAASDDWCAYSGSTLITTSRSRIHTVTAGTNVVEMVAKVASGTGTILRADLVVIPLY